MPSKQHNDTAKLLAELQSLITDFSGKLGKFDVRGRVQALVPAFHKLRSLGSSLLGSVDSQSARPRILEYFKLYPQTVIHGDELMVVSGIGEWARRVRELRVQFGWLIYTGTTFKDISEEDPELIEELQNQYGINPLELKPSHYVLISTEQDRDAAHRWNVLNAIRKKNASVKDKILEHLRANVGQHVTGEELKYLAKNRNEWARRARELRTEAGWPVVTKQSGRPDLPVGVYVLELDRQAEEHDRKIPDPIRVEVLNRDGFACTNCKWERSMASPDDPRRFLELHHKVQHQDKGPNTAENLITVCNVCHDEIHRTTKTK